MAAKSSMDEEQAMLPNMHANTEIDVNLRDFEIWERCDRFVTPAFTLLAWEPIHPDPIKLKSFVIKYSYYQGSPTVSKTQTIKKASALACLCNTAYMFRVKLHTVVNWKGQPLAIMPSEPGKKIFTTFVNGMSLPVGRCKILETGDIISCYELDQPEVDFDSIFTGTSFDNDGNGPEEEKLTNQRRFSVKSILDVLATMIKAVVAVIIFAVGVLVAFVLCILAIPMLDSISGRNLSRLLPENA